MVDRPIEDVWAALFDLFNAPRLWGRHVLGLRQTSPGSLGLGSTLQGRMVILGFETRLNFVIKEWDPPHLLVMSGTARPLRTGAMRYVFEMVGDRTKIVRSSDLELRGPLKFVFPLIRPFMMRGMRASSRNLKQFIEARPRSQRTD